jgi:hypothetical protein
MNRLYHTVAAMLPVARRSAHTIALALVDKEHNMDNGHQLHHSHLFTVRLWQADLGDGQTEWRGKLQHVLSGEVHYFREWSALIALLMSMLSDAEARLDTD